MANTASSVMLENASANAPHLQHPYVLSPPNVYRTAPLTMTVSQTQGEAQSHNQNDTQMMAGEADVDCAGSSVAPNILCVIVTAPTPTTVEVLSPTNPVVLPGSTTNGSSRRSPMSRSRRRLTVIDNATLEAAISQNMKKASMPPLQSSSTSAVSAAEPATGNGQQVVSSEASSTNDTSTVAGAELFSPPTASPNAVQHGQQIKTRAKSKARRATMSNISELTKGRYLSTSPLAMSAMFSPPSNEHTSRSTASSTSGTGVENNSAFSLEKLQAQIASQQRKLRNLTIHNAQLTRDLSNQTAKVSELEMELTSVRRSKASMKELLDAHAESINDLQQSLQQSKLALSDEVAAKNEAEKRIHALEADIVRLKDEQRHEHVTIQQQTQEEVINARLDVQKSQELLKSKSEQLESLRTEHSALLQQLHSTQAERDASRSEVEEVKRQVNELQQQLEKERSAALESQSRTENALVKQERLKAQLEQFGQGSEHLMYQEGLLRIRDRQLTKVRSLLILMLATHYNTVYRARKLAFGLVKSWYKIASEFTTKLNQLQKQNRKGDGVSRSTEAGHPLHATGSTAERSESTKDTGRTDCASSTNSNSQTADMERGEKMEEDPPTRSQSIECSVVVDTGNCRHSEHDIRPETGSGVAVEETKPGSASVPSNMRLQITTPARSLSVSTIPSCRTSVTPSATTPPCTPIRHDKKHLSLKDSSIHGLLSMLDSLLPKLSHAFDSALNEVHYSNRMSSAMFSRSIDLKSELMTVQARLTKSETSVKEAVERESKLRTELRSMTLANQVAATVNEHAVSSENTDGVGTATGGGTNNQAPTRARSLSLSHVHPSLASSSLSSMQAPSGPISVEDLARHCKPIPGYRRLTASRRNSMNSLAWKDVMPMIAAQAAPEPDATKTNDYIPSQDHSNERSTMTANTAGSISHSRRNSLVKKQEAMKTSDQDQAHPAPASHCLADGRSDSTEGAVAPSVQTKQQPRTHGSACSNNAGKGGIDSITTHLTSCMKPSQQQQPQPQRQRSLSTPYGTIVTKKSPSPSSTDPTRRRAASRPSLASTPPTGTTPHTSASIAATTSSSSSVPNSRPPSPDVRARTLDMLRQARQQRSPSRHRLSAAKLNHSSSQRNVLLDHSSSSHHLSPSLPSWPSSMPLQTSMTPDASDVHTANTAVDEATSKSRSNLFVPSRPSSSFSLGPAAVVCRGGEHDHDHDHDGARSMVDRESVERELASVLDAIRQPASNLTRDDNSTRHQTETEAEAEARARLFSRLHITSKPARSASWANLQSSSTSRSTISTTNGIHTDGNMEVAQAQLRRKRSLPALKPMPLPLHMHQQPPLSTTSAASPHANATQHLTQLQLF